MDATAATPRPGNSGRATRPCPRCTGHFTSPGWSRADTARGRLRAVVCGRCRTDEEVCAAFGMPVAPEREWPVAGHLRWPDATNAPVVTLGFSDGVTVQLRGWHLTSRPWRRTNELRFELSGMVQPGSGPLPEGGMHLISADLPGPEPLPFPLLVTTAVQRCGYTHSADLTMSWFAQPRLGPGRPGHDPRCLYCAHGPDCQRCPRPADIATISRSYVCTRCSLELTRARIAADPYYAGPRANNLACFGDDE